MSRKIFVNLAVKDLPKSMDFFRELGFTFNEKFTNENAACLVISEEIYSMLLTQEMFASFTPKTVADATQVSEVLIALSCESREAVDALADKALTAGGTFCREPQDHGFMYERTFQDLDGHIWELFWMDEASFPEQPK